MLIRYLCDYQFSARIMNAKPSIFTAKEVDENNERRVRLVELIASGDSILMAGSGCSAKIYPDWQGFINRMDEVARDLDPKFSHNSEDFLSYADAVKECLGNDRYYDLINEEFGLKEVTHLEMHKVLCQLPFKALTTTNYDVVLENALTEITLKSDNSLYIEGTVKTRINQFLRSLNFNDNLPRRVVHLHGIYHAPDSIILSGKEYKHKYGFSSDIPSDTLFDRLKDENLTKEVFEELLLTYGYGWPIRRKILWSLLATRRVVFFGFSMRDPYFRKMLDFVREDISTYNKDNHYIILRITEKNKISLQAFAATLKKDFGIESVFFEDSDGNGLDNFIIDLGKEIILPEKPKTDFVAPASEIKVKDGDLAETLNLFEISKKLNQHGN